MLLIRVTLLLFSLVATSLCMTAEEFDAAWRTRLNSARTFREHNVQPNRHSSNVKITALVNTVVDDVERVEALKAVIKHPLPDKGVRTENFGDTDRKFMREKLGAKPIDQSTKLGDEAGHILGYALGGPIDRRNLFPQHRGSNRNANERHALIDWVEFEKALRQYMLANPRGKIEYKILFHFPTGNSASSSRQTGSRPDRDRPVDSRRYEVNRPQKFDFYAKLFRDDNVAEFECELHMSNSKDGFSLPSASSRGRSFGGRTAMTTTVRTTTTTESPAARYCNRIF